MYLRKYVTIFKIEEISLNLKNFTSMSKKRFKSLKTPFCFSHLLAMTLSLNNISLLSFDISEHSHKRFPGI